MQALFRATLLCTALIPFNMAQGETVQAPELPLRYINPPGLKRDLNSLGAVEQSWIPTVRLIAAATDPAADFGTELDSAFAELDRQLAEHHARRHAIVRLDVSFRGARGDIAAIVDQRFQAYFKSRMGSMEGPDGGIDYPVRTVLGLGDLQTHSDVVLDAEIVDRDNIDITFLVDPEMRRRAERGKRVLFGGLGSAGLPAGRAGADRLIASVKSILAAGGARLTDLATLTAYVMQPGTDGGWPTILRASLDAAGAGPVKLEVKPVDFADRTGQAIVLAGEARTDPEPPK